VPALGAIGCCALQCSAVPLLERQRPHHRPPVAKAPLRKGNWNLLITRRECVGLTRLRLRTYAKHLTAASWKLWRRLASTVDTVLCDVSMYMACSWILNALC
jgi:hypothetical protein